jgi:predicted deacylase
MLTIHLNLWLAGDITSPAASPILMKNKLPPYSCMILGNNPGPSVVILGGIHGDEQSGVKVLEILKHKFGLNKDAFGLFDNNDISGQLYLIIGNPEAVRLKQRSASGKHDLNRCFIQKGLDMSEKDDDPYDLIRARELAPILANADYVIDIHATSNPSPSFIVSENDTPKTRELLQILPVEYMLTDPWNVLAKDLGLELPGTTDAYVNSNGGTAIGYETGQEGDLSRINDVAEDIIRILKNISSLRGDIRNISRTKPQYIFALTHSIQAVSSDFVYENGMENGWKRIRKNDLIGTYKDGTEERSKVDGMLIFPKSTNKIEMDKNLYYIANQTAIVE